MIRKLLIGISMAALVAVLYPATADAAETGTVVFTAGAEVCDPGPSGTCSDGTPADFWAPVAPLSNCASSQPDLCDASPSRYEFSTLIPGHGGQFFCAGVGHDGTNTGFNSGVGTDQCDLSSEGQVNPGPLGVGPYCGYSSGEGIARGSIGGTVSLDNVHVEWAAAAGGVLPLVLRDGSASGAIIGSGAVATSGASPGTCGLNPSDGFSPTHTFAVTGYASVNRV